MVSTRVDTLVTWLTSRPPRREPASIEVIQNDYHHDMLVLTYYAEPATAARYRAGSPLVVQWGVFPNKTETFYGTVLYVRAHLENSKHSLRVVCIGTSYPFKDGDPAAYNDLSVEQVVSDGVRGAGLNLVRPKTSVSWPLLVRHADESSWSFYARLAKRMGYTWYVNKTTAYLYDPVEVLLANSDSYPVLNYHFGQGNDFTGDIISFTPELGEQGVPGRTQQEERLLAVDPRTLSIIGAGTDGEMVKSLAQARTGARFSTYLDSPAYSVEEAAARVRGRRANNRWRHQAEAVAFGNARVRQGTGVHIEGVSQESNGLWYVERVKHKVTKEEHPQQWRYIMHLTLVRDSQEIRHAPRLASRSLRSAVTKNGSETNLRAPASVWRQDRWVSAYPTEMVLP